jgi:hypothetical protein
VNLGSVDAVGIKVGKIQIQGEGFSEDPIRKGWHNLEREKRAEVQLHTDPAIRGQAPSPRDPILRLNMESETGEIDCSGTMASATSVYKLLLLALSRLTARSEENLLRVTEVPTDDVVRFHTDDPNRLVRSLKRLREKGTIAPDGFID